MQTSLVAAARRAGGLRHRNTLLRSAVVSTAQGGLGDLGSSAHEAVAVPHAQIYTQIRTCRDRHGQQGGDTERISLGRSELTQSRSSWTGMVRAWTNLFLIALAFAFGIGRQEGAKASATPAPSMSCLYATANGVPSRIL